jgi:hypothetical protein
VLNNPASGFAAGPVDRALPEAIGNQLLHTVVPLLAVLDWLLFDRQGRFRWRYAVYWLAFPLGYLAFALVRGLIVDKYPYPFINADKLGYDGVAVSSLVFAVAFWILGLLFVAIDRLLRRRPHHLPVTSNSAASEAVESPPTQTSNVDGSVTQSRTVGFQ